MYQAFLILESLKCSDHLRPTTKKNVAYSIQRHHWLNKIDMLKRTHLLGHTETKESVTLNLKYIQLPNN